jgi:tetratricopeptide (TPR) repeat protein
MMTRILAMRAVLALLLLWGAAPAQASHRGSGESNPAPGNVGLVSFENSGARAAQADFLYGLAQLHNFEYASAAEAFRRAQKTDPGFAMAYWGEAMTYNHPVWFQQDLAAARAALARLAATPEARLAKAGSAREKEYLRAVEILYGEGSKHERDRRYAQAMEALHAKYPADVDATCLYALALLGTSDAGRHVPTYMRSAALMQEVFEHHPRHPGAAHYLIHSVDDAVHAPLGLRAARAYGRIAPEADHAQHMTSHIYLALGMWEETVRANEIALQVRHRQLLAKDPKARAPACGHYIIWLSYAKVQQGRMDDARAIIQDCAARLQEAAPKNPAQRQGYETSLLGLAQMRARYLVDGKAAQDPAAGLAALAAGNPDAALVWAVTDAWMAMRNAAPEAAQASVASAREVAASYLAAKAHETDVAPEHARYRIPAIEMALLDGQLALRRGEREAALALFRQAAQQEQALEMDFGPPVLVQPASEWLGKVLLQLQRPVEARKAFEAANVLAPGRSAVREGLAAADAMPASAPATSVAGTR